MIDVTLDSLAHLALPYLPDVSRPITTTFSLPVDIQRSLTQREERSALGGTLRVRAGWTMLLQREAATELRNALRTIQDTQVRVPFWPGMDALSGPFSSRWWLGFDAVPDSTGQVENVQWDNSSTGMRVPTLLGYLDGSPQFRSVTADMVEVSVAWVESSTVDDALTLSSGSWTAGPSIAGITRYVFPFTPNWASGAEAGKVRVDVRREWLGFHRESAAEAYEQVGQRLPKFHFTLTVADAGTLLRFFADRKASVEPFWLPGYLSEVALASNTSSGSADVTLTDATPIADFSYIAFVVPGGSVVARKIVSRVGNTLTLDSSPGTLSAASTVVCTLALVRFSEDKLAVTWNMPLAELDIAFDEVANEYSSPPADPLQTSQGDAPSRAYVFRVSHGTTVYDIATWDQGLTASPGGFDDGFDDGFEHAIEYDPAAGGTSEFFDGPAWDESSLTFECRYSASNPLSRLIAATATERVRLTVLEVTPAAVGDPWTSEETVFSGVVTSVQFDGAFIRAEAKSAGMAMQRRVPRALLQLTDNWSLFGIQNGLEVEDWTFEGTLSSISGRNLTFSSLTWPGGTLPTIGLDYFALGYVQRPSGASFERIPIASSQAASGTSVTVELVRSLSSTPTTPESGWSLVPGYDGSVEMADDKFGNLSNFGGFPFVPASNPSIIPKKKNTTAGGKK